MNQGRFIEAAIRSVLLQDYHDLEYLIMDGGSTDGSVATIRKYEQRLAYWQSKPDGGQYRALNEGFSRTSGDIMLWLNSDDMLMPGSLNLIAALFSEFPAVEWITGIPVYWSKDGRSFQILPQLPYHRRLMQIGGYEGRAVHWVMQECTAWTRGLWQRAGAHLATDLPLAGDFELWRRFSFQAQLYTVAAFVGGNRQHPDQQTATADRYCDDVDKVLRKRPMHAAANRILRMPLIRKLVRAALLLPRRRNHIYFDARTNRWIIS